MDAIMNRGYLNENYRLFHSADRISMDFQTHCHTFHKIILCLKGHVTYIVEGKTYHLQPWDILMIPEFQIHRSILDSDEVYERMVLWIQDSYLKSFNEPALSRIFVWPLERKLSIYRPGKADRGELLQKFQAVWSHQQSDGAGHQLMADSYLIQLLLTLSRLLDSEGQPDLAVYSDPKLDDIMTYINRNLTQDLSVNALSGRFFISASSLMHRFKRHTGISVHQYVLQKRLFNAYEKIQTGELVVNAAYLSGFQEYSVFLKAFKKAYGCLPSSIRIRADE